MASRGSVSKTNLSSFDNPLAHPNPPNLYRPPPLMQQFQNYQPNFPQSLSQNQLYQNNFPQSQTNQYTQNFPSQSYNLNNYRRNDLNNSSPSLNNYPPLEAFRKPQIDTNRNEPPQQSQQQPQQQSQQQQQQNQFTPQQLYPSAFDNYQPNFDQANFNRDIRFDVDVLNKQAYKQALDQQVAEKEVLKLSQEKARLKSEIETIKQYPFGRRTDPSTYIDDSKFTKNNYQPSFGKSNTDEISKLNKDNIVEKPNSLSADVPPYDPIKHRNGFHQGYNYDPWGKPGGGAPLIDPSTGKKFTKYTGQVWYDTIGLSPDERAKFFQDKNRPLTLEEQKNEIEAEKQRKRTEEESYKSRTGDLASWIKDLESTRLNKIHSNGGAHLPHTNVTREKINQEYARKHNIDQSTKTYHDELGLQLEERNRQNKLYKLKDDVAGIEHTKKWDDWWGKPGGGAPNNDVRRQDLIENLTSPRDKEFSTDGMSLPVGSEHLNLNDSELLYAKGTVKSNHRNMYDNPQKMKL